MYEPILDYQRSDLRSPEVDLLTNSIREKQRNGEEKTDRKTIKTNGVTRVHENQMEEIPEGFVRRNGNISLGQTLNEVQWHNYLRK